MDELIALVHPHDGCGSEADFRRLTQLFDLHGIESRQIAQLLDLYSRTNGGMLLDQSIVILPISEESFRDIFSWNEKSLWRSRYPSDFPGVCFAEDLFGNQFCVSAEGVSLMDAETQEFEPVGADLFEWASRVMEEGWLSGCELSAEWIETQEGIGYLHRLVPVRPFAVGGEFEIRNLVKMGALDSMKVRARLACAIQEFPDGTWIEVSGYSVG